MILSDREIRQYLAEKKIIIEPLEEGQIQPACVDLRLGNEFRVFRRNRVAFIDIKQRQENYTEQVILEDDKPFILHPGEFVLGAIKEYIKLPSDLTAVVDGRSSIARLGVSIHTTSGFINPGWGGRFVLEIGNTGKMPVLLYPGTRICKIIFFRLTSAAEVPYDKKLDAKYNESNSIDASKLSEEFLS